MVKAGFKVERTLAVEREYAGRHAGQCKPLADSRFRHAETGSDFADISALLDEVAPRHELVGRMHGDPHDIFSKTQLGIVLPVFAQMARYRCGLAEVSGLGQSPQGEIAALSGDDGVSTLRCLADQQGIEKAMGRNGRGQLVKAGFNAGLADVAFPEDEFVEGNVDQV
jgi:hypothetical protein